MSMALRLVLKLNPLKSFFKRYLNSIGKSLCLKIQEIWYKFYTIFYNHFMKSKWLTYPSITGVLSNISLAFWILSSDGNFNFSWECFDVRIANILGMRRHKKISFKIIVINCSVSKDKTYYASEFWMDIQDKKKCVNGRLKSVSYLT